MAAREALIQPRERAPAPEPLLGTAQTAETVAE
jgi:hypothetical protein